MDSNSWTYVWLMIIIGINYTLQLWTHILEMLLLVMHQNTKLFTIAKPAQNKPNWRNRQHLPWGCGACLWNLWDHTRTSMPSLDLPSTRWILKYWHESNWGPTWMVIGLGHKTYQERLSPRFVHTEEKATGRSCCCLQLLSGRLWEDRAKNLLKGELGRDETQVEHGNSTLT